MRLAPPQCTTLVHLRVTPREIKFFLWLLLVQLVAKGGVLSRGFAVDDYVNTYAPAHNSPFQGRPLEQVILYLIKSVGINHGDMYLVFGLMALFVQTLFVVSLLRFVGVQLGIKTAIAAALIVAHPYSAEILTFRSALPIYSAALIFSTVTLEVLMRDPNGWGTRVLASLSAIAALFTYQIVLNYLLLAIIFSLIFAQLYLISDFPEERDIKSQLPKRAMGLAFVLFFSVTAFMMMMKVVSLWLGVKAEGRAELISKDDIPLRIDQFLTSLQTIYWSDEPVMPGWLKLTIAALLVLSVLAVVGRIFLSSLKQKRARDLALLLIFAGLLAVASLGIIIPFKAWWPVPRVLAHSAVIVGLIFMLGDVCRTLFQNRALEILKTFVRLIVLACFVLINNQIFADQQRMNEWDKMTATRIIARLESFSDFRGVKAIHVSGGYWRYPLEVKTIQGDMNMSALYPGWVKVAMLIGASGYHFSQANIEEQVRGEEYCKTVSPWPAMSSIKIEGNLAVICLQK